MTCRLVLAAVLVGISVTPTAAEFPQLPAAAASQQGTALIHVLIVADTKDPTIGKGTETDLAALTQFFEENVSGDSLDLHALTGDSVTQEQILKVIDSFYCRRYDAMVFFWSGHGAYDAHGHFFPTRTGRLYRATVMQHVKNRGARLNAVISDSCNVYVPGTSERGVECKTKPLPQTAVILDNLFLKSQGTVDLNGSSEGQCGFCDPARNNGGTFLGPFVDVAYAYRDQRLDWLRFVNILRPEVQKAFERVCPNGCTLPDGHTQQNTQTIRVWGVLPQAADGQHRLARLMSLERGDCILAINARPIHNHQECIDAVLTSSTVIVLQVRDRRNGTVRKLRGELLPPGARHRLGIEVADAPGKCAVIIQVYAGYPARRLLEVAE